MRFLLILIILMFGCNEFSDECLINSEAACDRVCQNMNKENLYNEYELFLEEEDNTEFFIWNEERKHITSWKCRCEDEVNIDITGSTMQVCNNLKIIAE